MNVNIIVYVWILLLVLYFNPLVVSTGYRTVNSLGQSVIKMFKIEKKLDYRDYLCNNRKSETSCNSIVNLNERPINMNPGNLRNTDILDF
jgi:hypothetical protein